MPFPQRFLPDPQCLLKMTCGIFVLLQACICEGEIVVVPGTVRVIGSELLFTTFHDPSAERRRFGELPLLKMACERLKQRIQVLRSQAGRRKTDRDGSQGGQQSTRQSQHGVYSEDTDISPEPETFIFKTLYPGKDCSLPLTVTLSPTTSTV